MERALQDHVLLNPNLLYVALLDVSQQWCGGMFMLDPELDKALRELIKQWNIAEKRIKKAEQVRAEQVVASAIFELRYAGRKIVDAIEIALATNLSSDHDARERVYAYIADATEDCVKAKHDAIDAMMSFVTTWFNRAEDFLTLERIQQFFPDYLKILSTISTIQRNIMESRGDRTRLRDAIYDDIEVAGYDDVLNLYDQMRLSGEKVAASVEEERRRKRRDQRIVVAGVVLGIAGLIELSLSLMHYAGLF
jgi:hypothetical protein